MKSKFKRELHEFLEKERISLESGIVNDITYRLAKIELNEDQRSEGFSFDDRWLRKEEKEKIRFSIPTGLHWPNIEKISKFFTIDPTTYEANKPLTIDNPMAIEQFIDQFKQCFLEIKDKEPKTIARYKMLSAPILEASAEETLREFIKEANDILLAENLQELTDSWKALVEFIILLSGQMRALEKFPLFYKDILSSVYRAKFFLTVPEIMEHKALASKLTMIIEGIELYSRYHRNESVLALLTFEKEFKGFLENYRISTKNCDVLEDVVLDLAGAKLKSLVARSHFSPGSDRARFTITFADIDKENTQKVIDYLVNLGDESACEGYGWRKHGSSLAEKAEVQCAYLGSGGFEPGSDSPIIKLESHTIEMDGKFFYDKLLPRVKEKIDHMEEDKSLGKYQGLSEDLFPIPPKPICLFRRPGMSMFQNKEEPRINLPEAMQLDM